MRVYETADLRNISLVAHGGAGKTSLAEAILFNGGLTKRLGRVDEGNTVTDYHPEEIKRRVTINTTPVPCEWNNKKINIMDTPGYADFIGDVKSSLRVSDAVVMVVCAVSGVEVQTETIWQYANEAKLPKMVFINKIDRENASFNKVLEELQGTFQENLVPLVLPLGEAESFQGVLNIFTRESFIYDGTAGKGQVSSVPADLEAGINEYREKLIEAAAEADDDLLNKYLEGEELSREELLSGLRTGIKTGKVVPVLCGSALQNKGIDQLLNAIVEFLPPPVSALGDAAMSKVPAALVFKTLADPYVGRVSFLRIYQGSLKSDSIVYNSSKEAEEKIAQVLIPAGKNQFPVPEANAGDIVALTKLQLTGTADTLTSRGSKLTLPRIEFPRPALPVAIVPKSKGDEDKLSSALSRLMEEDPTLDLSKNLETKQTILSGMGELHLDITLERLQRKFGVEVEVETPRIPYRETIKVAVKHVEGKHKKQTGGHGQYGHVFIDMEPLPDKDFEFNETIFGGSVPKQYIPAVEKGMRESLPEGILAGYPVSNIRVNLVDGSYHPVDSSEMAFKIAASIAFKKAMEQAKPVILEPIAELTVFVPEQFMGDIIGDLNSKRGRVLGIEGQDGLQSIKARAPLAEVHRYAIDLKSITQGRGSFEMFVVGYEEVPGQLAERIIASLREAKGS